MNAADSDPLLSHGQRRLLGFAIGLFCLVASVVLIVLVAIALGRLIGHFSGVLWPLAVAGIFALMLRPVVDNLEERFGGRRVAAVCVLFSIFVLTLAGLIFAFGPPLTGQIIDFINSLPALWERIVTYVEARYPQWNDTFERLLARPEVSSMLQTLQSELGKIPAMVAPSLKAVGGGVFAVFGFFTSAIVVPLYLFFFLLSRSEPLDKLPENLTFIPERIRNDVVFLVREFIGIIVSFFRGQLLIAMIMGLLLALGFSIIGLQYGLALGLILGLLNVVPYLGTVVGLMLTIPLAALQPDGGLKLVALVLLVYIIVQNIEGWFLTPKIMGDRTGLHPVTIIVAIFFWGTALSGLLGMILAIPLTAFFVTAWRLLKRKYLARPAPALPR